MLSHAGRAAAAGVAALLLAGCVSRPATSAIGSGAADSSAVGSPGSAPPTTSSGTVVTVRQEGGFAGLLIESTVDGVAGRYQTVTRHLCGAEGANCPPPIDSAAGALSDSLAATVAATVDSAAFFTLRPDYGTDPRLRDGFGYTVTVRRDARTATVRADDSTRPPALVAITSAVAKAIDRARGRR